MELETVKIISRNDAIRGKSLDVYYFIEAGDIKLCSVEDVTGTTDIKDLLSGSALADIKSSLKGVLEMRELYKSIGLFSQHEINAGFVQAADANRAMGHSND